jgi:hypothetical protein
MHFRNSTRGCGSSHPMPKFSAARRSEAALDPALTPVRIAPVVMSELDSKHSTRANSPDIEKYERCSP